MAIIPTGRGTVGANGSAGYGGASTLTVHEGRIGNLELQTSGWVNVRSYGADGVALASAAAAASNAGSGLLIGSPVTITTAVGTISVPVRFEGGGKLVLNTGGSVTLSGPMMAPAAQVFDASGGGALTFSADVAFLLPHWWGAMCDGVTNDYPALNAMKTAIGATPYTLVVPGVCVVGTNITLPLTTMRVRFEGTGAFTGAGAVAFNPWFPSYVWDAASATTSLVDFDHHGAGATQTYAVDIHNAADNGAAPTPGTGAHTALVIHQYSDAGPSMQIDNTRTRVAIKIVNTHNESLANGQHGTGNYLELWGYSDSAVYPTQEPVLLGYIDDHLRFWASDTTRPWYFGGNSSAPALRVENTSTGNALHVIGGSTGGALFIQQTGAAKALTISATSGAAGQFPVSVAGQDYGPIFSTATDGGVSLTINKNGTGAGTLAALTNKGTGRTLTLSNGTVTSSQDVGTAAPVSGAHVVGEIVWNTVPAASGKIGWVCTGAGTPGTWKAFGAIDP